ncbi:hypothetical protein F5887DRAFT_966619 [Amanita rubescens]|nr:hypothetical protein F5887DRAFT_966619 [Amanita rubescens]
MQPRRHVPFATTNPYAFPSGPSRSRSTRLHSLIDYSTSTIAYDFVHPPSTMPSRRDRISSRALDEPATSPPMQSMTLHSPYLPWVIQVVASNRSFVSVRDIIDNIYHCLRTKVGGRELSKQFPKKMDQDRVTAAYRQRYRHYKDPRTYDEEKLRGLLRIDFLMGHSKFRGLSKTDSPSKWFLIFGE